MTKKHILICIDRDGTLTMDGKYHLGSQKNWKSLIHVCPKVTNGIKLLRKKIPRVKIYMITNQPGIAINEFPLLTQKRAETVCLHVLNVLRTQGAQIDGYRLCGKATKSYEKKRIHYSFNSKLVGNFSCIKPKIGMIQEILQELTWKQKDTQIFVIGDRVTDVQTGLNSKGKGILIPYSSESGQRELLENWLMGKDHHLKDIFIEEDMVKAAKRIIEELKK